MATIDIPDYRPVDKLGSSRLASVRLATQTSLERDVALKILSPGPAADPVISEQFLQSARTLASFAHPNVVQVYDIGLEPAPYYAMQYLSGGNFASRVRRGLDERELRRILEGVARALGYIHRRRHVHGSISPNNILFDANDTAILSDFGLLAARRKLAADGEAAPPGADGYVSPEVARGDTPDARSDIYSLGAVALFGLSGRSPAEAGDPPSPVPRLPPERAHWQPLLDKAMASDPNKRFQSAEALLAALASIDVAAAEVAVATPPPRGAAAPTQNAAAAAVTATAVHTAPAGGRRDGVAPPASHGEASPPASVPPPDGGTWLPIAIAVLGVLLIGGVGYGLWASRAPSSEPAPIAALADPDETPEPTPADPAAPQADAPSEPDFLSDPRLDADGRPIAPIDLRLVPTVVDPVAELVRLGRADLAAQRLTLPPERNALERFQLALKINPRTRAAREGIVQVARAATSIWPRTPIRPVRPTPSSNSSTRPLRSPPWPARKARRYSPKSARGAAAKPAAWSSRPARWSMPGTRPARVRCTSAHSRSTPAMPPCSRRSAACSASVRRATCSATRSTAAAVRRWSCSTRRWRSDSFR
ncbi:MAG: serine/threonine protein kinase [Dokdonella sp.]|nr:serine/threonine protein kinase [Dokdonella sp.]